VYSYLARRIVQALIVILINTVLIFTLSRMSSDPMSQYANRPGLTQADKDRIAHDLGLDQSMPVQYFKWMGLMLKGDMGESLLLQAAGEYVDHAAPADDSDPDDGVGNCDRAGIAVPGNCGGD